MKDDQTKVVCLHCGKKYYIDNEDVPSDAEKGEAFASQCTYGCDGKQAELA